MKADKMSGFFSYKVEKILLEDSLRKVTEEKRRVSITYYKNHFNSVPQKVYQTKALGDEIKYLVSWAIEHYMQIKISWNKNCFLFGKIIIKGTIEVIHLTIFELRLIVLYYIPTI